VAASYQTILKFLVITALPVVAGYAGVALKITTEARSTSLSGEVLPQMPKT
jgi:hypothetical protein